MTDDASHDLFDRRDRENARNYAAFVRGSVRRHRLLVAGSCAIVGGLSLSAVLMLPKTYHVEAKALAQVNSALTVRGDNVGADALTHVATETVLKQDSLLALIKDYNLIDQAHADRTPLQKARDGALHVVSKPETDAEKTDDMVKTLEKKLTVWTSDGGSTVSFSIDWDNAAVACRLVDAAQRTFLDARYAGEVTAQSESIGILQNHTTDLKADIDAAVASIEKIRDAAGANKAAVPVAAAPRLPVQHSYVVPAAPLLPAVSPLQHAELEAKIAALNTLEQARHQHMLELQNQLLTLQATYTEAHPLVQAIHQMIERAEVEPPEATALRQEIAALRGSSPVLPTSGTPSTRRFFDGLSAAPPALSSDMLRLDADLSTERDPAMVYARDQLRVAMDKYASLRSQIQTAQIDLETAQAAFKYRYSVITPARMPRNPTAPNVPLVALSGALIGLLFGIAVAVWLDVRSMRIFELWQVQKLGMPIIGNIELPRLQ